MGLCGMLNTANVSELQLHMQSTDISSGELLVQQDTLYLMFPLSVVFYQMHKIPIFTAKIKVCAFSDQPHKSSKHRRRL